MSEFRFINLSKCFNHRLMRSLFCTVLFLCLLGCAGDAKATTYSGVFTSSVINVGGAPTSITWTDTVPAGTSVTMQVRAGNVPTPDGTWTEYSSVAKAGSLAAYAGNEYIQYAATLSGDGTAEPSLDSVTITYRGGVLISSPYNSEDSTLVLGSLTWSQSVAGTATVGLQLRTSPDGATWTAWCGPDNGGAGCSSATYFTDPAGAQTIDSMLTDGANDKYVEYRAVLTSDGTNIPIVTGVTVNYSIDPTRSRAYNDVSASSVIDATEAASYLNINWNDTVPIGTSLLMQVRAGNTATPDGTWTSWLNFSKGGSLSTFNGQRYIQWQVTLSTDGLAEPILSDVTIGLITRGILISSPYDAGALGTMLGKFTWMATVPDPVTSSVRLQLASSADGTNWTGWCGTEDGNAECDGSQYLTDPSGSEVIDSELTDGVNDRYFRYRIIIESSSSSNPTVSNINLQYVLNAQPQVLVTSASQGSTGTISANYTVSDADLSDPHTAYIGAYVNSNLNETLTAVDQTAITVTNINNLPSSGTILVGSEMISYTGKSGNDLVGTITRGINNTRGVAHSSAAEIYVLGSHTEGTGSLSSIKDGDGNPLPKSISWTIATDLPGVYLANTAKIIVAVNDGNGALQLGSGTSAVLDVLDTKPPVVTSIIINGVLNTDNATLNVAEDDSAFTMKASTIQSDLDSLSDYATYAPTVTVNLNAQTTIYFRFIDWKNNVANYTANIPAKVLNPIVQDVSNGNASQYRLFVSFSPISEPIHAFDSYHLYTSDSQAGTYTEITPTTLNTLATNYYMDDALIQDQTKYYKIAAADDLGNYSALSDAAFGIANGHEDSGEGAGGNQTPPVITHDPSSQLTNITASTATISFTTDKSSDSIVQFSTDTSYTQNQGTITFIPTGTTHSVTLIGLGENTKYYYKIISHDVNASTGTLENVETQTFTTITDNTAPLIDTIGSSVDEISATIRFKTDEGAKATIHYGTVDGVYPDAFTETSYNFDHSVVLTNLLPGTPYFYTIEAEDNSLLKNKSTSPRQTFTTLTSSDTVAPIISNVNVGAVTYNSAVITFSTNENANSVIEFGKDHYLGQIIEGSLSERVTAHSVMLVGLVPNSVYYFKPKALDAAGNIGQTSAVYTLTTIAAPNPPAGSLAITNIGITNITSTGATVAWTTNDSSDSVVGYSLDTSYTEVAGSTTLANVHSVTLQNLAPDSVYNLKLISENQSGQVAEATQNGGQNITVSTLSGGDKISPVLTFDPTVQIENITSTRATISWTTNENSNTLIDYSKNSGVFTSTQGRYKDNLIVHRFTLTNLEPETAYYFQLRSEDPAGNGVRDNNAGVGYTFTTATAQDTKSPIIDDISVTSTSSTIATITWTTDKPASSLVDFGVTNTYGITQGNAGELVQSHTVTLIGLTPNTAYFFRVKSIDENGNQGMDNNSGRSYTFTTASIQNPGDTALPAITFNPATGITNITSTTALISWTTDKPSTSDVGYSLDASFAQEQGAFNLTTNHQVSLIDLAPSTLYHFQIKSQDENGNLGINSNSSAGYTFTTLAGADRIPPVITNVKVDAIAGTLATVSWNTNENASSLVEYGTDVKNLSSTAGNYTEMVTAHSVAVSNLLPLTTYYFRVRSQDGSKNTSVDDGGDTPYTFITLGSEDVCPVYSGGGGGGSTADTTPPKISNVKIDSIVDTGAVVTWDTDKGGYSIVEYSTDESFDNSVFWGNPKKMEQKHSVKIIGLSAATTYYYRPLSADSSGNLAQAEGMNFATSVAVEKPIDKPTDNPIDKPTDKPAVPTQTLQQQTEDKIQELVQSGFTEEEIKQIVANFSSPFKITSESPKVSDITNNSAKINWMTDKKTNSVVQFRVEGNSNAPVKEFGIFNELDFNHNVILSNLDSGITYEFLAQSSDVLGNTLKSSWYSFTTNTTPSIYDVAISGVNLSSATVEWKTNIPSSDELEYGLSINYGNKFESKVNEKAIAHIVKLNNLESGKTYHYRIKGIDTNGNILSSDDYTLTTYTLPQVQNYSIVSINEREAVISWTTNVETDSTVKYTDTKTDEVKSQGEDALAKTHNFNLKGLEPGVDYIIQIQGRDSYGNQAVSSEFSLKTLADTTPPAFGRVNIETAVSQGKDSQVRTIISYTTSEPATTQVLYGQGADDNQYSQSTPLDENLTTNHVIVVTDFKSATVYKFKLQAKDGAGNIQDSQDFTVLVPEEKKSVIQMISQNLENTFGWLKKLKG